MDIFPDIGYLSHMADQFPLAKVLSILISIVARQGTLLTNMEQECPFPLIFMRADSSRFLCVGLSHRSEVGPQYGLCLHFSNGYGA